MRELSEYTEELHRRVEMKIETRRQHRRRALTVCVPLALVLVISAAALPRLLERSVRETMPGPSGIFAGGDYQDSLEDGNDAAPEFSKVQENMPASAPFEDREIASEQMEGLSPADEITPEAVPADFSFRYVWGCYGISSYDSFTGELVKTNNATHPEDYITKHELTEAERNEVWALLSGLGLEDYPANYDPYNDPDSDQRVASEPNRDLVLSFRAGGTETTVSCRGICLGGAVGGYDAKARAFLAACDRLEQLLTGTPEWQALPDYEFYYE